MRTIVLLALIAFAVAEKDYYKIKDEHYDVNALIANRVALQAFADCFEDKGPCSDEYIAYKKDLREAVETACKQCDSNYRYLFWRFLQGLKEYSLEEYWNFRHFYDPDNKYFEALEKAISKYVKPDMELTD